MRDNKLAVCHVSKGLLCLYKAFGSMGTDFYRAQVAYTKLTRWETVYENPECVKNVLNAEYWQAVSAIDADGDDDDKFALYLFLGVAVGAVLIVGILLLVIYLKKGKSEDDEGITEGLKVATGQ